MENIWLENTTLFNNDIIQPLVDILVNYIQCLSQVFLIRLYKRTMVAVAMQIRQESG